MARVYIPAPLRALTGEQDQVETPGETVGAVIAALDGRFPGFRAAVCADERLRPGLAVSINGTVAPRGLRQPVGPNDELHFLPALGGG